MTNIYIGNIFIAIQKNRVDEYSFRVSPGISLDITNISSSVTIDTEVLDEHVVLLTSDFRISERKNCDLYLTPVGYNALRPRLKAFAEISDTSCTIEDVDAAFYKYCGKVHEITKTYPFTLEQAEISMGQEVEQT